MENRVPRVRKRIWTAAEDSALVQCMSMLVSERGRLYPMRRLTELMELQIPGSGFSQMQIESRLKLLKREYYCIHEMLLDFPMFTWDSVNHKVVGSEDAWIWYIQAHGHRAWIRDRSFPMFMDLDQVFTIIRNNEAADQLGNEDVENVAAENFEDVD